MQLKKVTYANHIHMRQWNGRICISYLSIFAFYIRKWTHFISNMWIFSQMQEVFDWILRNIRVCDHNCRSVLYVTQKSHIFYARKNFFCHMNVLHTRPPKFQNYVDFLHFLFSAYTIPRQFLWLNNEKKLFHKKFRRKKITILELYG